MTNVEKPPTPSEVQTDSGPLSQDAAALIGTGNEGTLADQFRAYIQRVKGGDMGSLPALAGLIALGILFSALDSVFFSKTNIANLLTQTAALMMLSMALTFVILAGVGLTLRSRRATHTSPDRFGSCAIGRSNVDTTAPPRPSGTTAVRQTDAGCQ